jgi:hypothetical protein
MRGLMVVLAGVLAIAGCGQAEPAAQVSQPDFPEAIQLPVLLEGDTGWEINVPVAKGWDPVVEAGQPIAAITRPFGDGCMLLVQVAATGSAGKPDTSELKDVENGTRATTIGRPQGDARYGVRSMIGQAQRLTFSGGVTGPGGLASIDFEPEDPSDAPTLNLTAQGGTDGPGCLTQSNDSAPGIVVEALRLMASDASLRYTP